MSYDLFQSSLRIPQSYRPLRIARASPTLLRLTAPSSTSISVIDSWLGLEVELLCKRSTYSSSSLRGKKKQNMTQQRHVWQSIDCVIACCRQKMAAESDPRAHEHCRKWMNESSHPWTKLFFWISGEYIPFVWGCVQIYDKVTTEFRHGIFQHVDFKQTSLTTCVYLWHCLCCESVIVRTGFGLSPLDKEPFSFYKHFMLFSWSGYYICNDLFSFVLSLFSCYFQQYYMRLQQNYYESFTFQTDVLSYICPFNFSLLPIWPYTSQQRSV